MHKPTYSSWRSMIKRCLNKKHPSFKKYGAQGVTVCGRWRTYAFFVLDMGERPQGMTLDRIDNTKGYQPDNCRWATTTQQALNRRMLKTNTTGFIGVWLDKRCAKAAVRPWRAGISFRDKTIHLGSFASAVEAARARDAAAVELYGPDAVLNFKNFNR